MPAPPDRRSPHTATQQWQSFEIRMRYRRAERCVLRAEAALGAGMEEEARAALDEARALNPDAPTFDEVLAARMRRRAAEEAARQSRLRRVVLVASAVLLMGLALGWTVGRPKNDAPAVSGATASGTVPAPTHESVPDAATSPMPGKPAVPEEPPVVASAATDPGPAAASPGPETTAGTQPEPSPRETSPPPARDPAPRDPPSPAPAEERASPGPPPPVLPPPPVPTTADTLPQPRVEASPLTGVGASVAASSPPPPPAPAPRPEPVREAPAAPDGASQEAAIRAVLARFEAAYSSLSASAARQVWPSVDERSLDRAFASLESQQVSLGNCSLQMQASTARADCRGTTTWAPRIGGGRRTDRRSWQFELAQSNGAWHIVSAQAR